MDSGKLIVLQDDINKFTDFCLRVINVQDEHREGIYLSLPACILDCVYSLRAKYYSTTVPVVERYAASYLNGNRFSEKDCISELIKRIEDVGGPEPFASEILKNRQKTGGVPKGEVVFRLAQYLKCLGIETIRDFRTYPHQDLLYTVIHAVKGLGDAGTNYLFMLAGDEDKCKSDVHLLHAIKDAIGRQVSNQECEQFMRCAVGVLKKLNPSLTVSKLDGMLWRKYQSGR